MLIHRHHKKYELNKKMVEEEFDDGKILLIVPCGLNSNIIEENSEVRYIYLNGIQY